MNNAIGSRGSCVVRGMPGKRPGRGSAVNNVNDSHGSCVVRGEAGEMPGRKVRAAVGGWMALEYRNGIDNDHCGVSTIVS